jgi:hypothetical protein
MKLIGNTTTASEGVVVNDELALAPVYRPGQLLETVPGHCHPTMSCKDWVITNGMATFATPSPAGRTPR